MINTNMYEIDFLMTISLCLQKYYLFTIFIQIIVENDVNNYVENFVNNHTKQFPTIRKVDFHIVFIDFFASFPLKHDEKRYKLIIFAPKCRIVDKVFILLIVNKKKLTVIVNNTKPRVDNETSKKSEKKF